MFFLFFFFVYFSLGTQINARNGDQVLAMVEISLPIIKLQIWTQAIACILRFSNKAEIIMAVLAHSQQVQEKNFMKNEIDTDCDFPAANSSPSHFDNLRAFLNISLLIKTSRLQVSLYSEQPKPLLSALLSNDQQKSFQQSSLPPLVDFTLSSLVYSCRPDPTQNLMDSQYIDHSLSSVAEKINSQIEFCLDMAFEGQSVFNPKPHFEIVVTLEFVYDPVMRPIVSIEMKLKGLKEDDMKKSHYQSDQVLFRDLSDPCALRSQLSSFDYICLSTSATNVFHLGELICELLKDANESVRPILDLRSGLPRDNVPSESVITERSRWTIKSVLMYVCPIQVWVEDLGRTNFRASSSFLSIGPIYAAMNEKLVVANAELSIWMTENRIGSKPQSNSKVCLIKATTSDVVCTLNSKRFAECEIDQCYSTEETKEDSQSDRHFSDSAFEHNSTPFELIAINIKGIAFEFRQLNNLLDTIRDITTRVESKLWILKSIQEHNQDSKESFRSSLSQKSEKMSFFSHSTASFSVKHVVASLFLPLKVCFSSFYYYKKKMYIIPPLFLSILHFFPFNLFDFDLPQ